MKRILIVDDQPVNLEYLRTVLEAANYEVLEASDGVEALRLAREQRPDLVLADILMPRMDGCELVLKLRSDDDVASTPVIFLTAHYVEREVEELATACGVDCIITKPVEPQTVLRTVRKAMQQSATSMQRDAVERAGNKHLRLLTDTLAKKAQQLEVSNRRLDALVQLGRRIASEHDPRRLLSVFCNAASDILDARCAIVAVTEDGGRTARHVTGNGIDPEEVSRLTSSKLVGALFRTCMPLSSVRLFHSGDPGSGEGDLPRGFAGAGKVLIGPIETGSRTYGIMCLAGLSLMGAQEEAAKRLAASMGAVLGVAYENAVRFEQIENHASRLRVEVAERTRAQEQVELANERLEQRVEARTRALKESHAQLRQAERMASMGTLCAGLGHDMGNILLPIRARLQALQQVVASGDGEDHTRAIGKYVEYLQSLTNGLRMLAVDSHAESRTPPSTDLSKWYQDAQPLLRSPLSGQMTLQARLPETPVAVRLSRHQLMQVMYNLVHNAADAMRSRRTGRIEISAEVIDDGQRVRCTVSDNGPGMPEEVRCRAAEPFFTTKHREFSTGLGLSLVRGIIGSAGGTLSIESKTDCGTDVVLEIPAAMLDMKGDDPNARSQPQAAVTLADERLCALARSTLNDLGYEVQPENRGPSKPPSAALWLLDASRAEVQEISAFLDSASEHVRRTVMLLGSIEDPSLDDFEGIVRLGEGLRASELCKRLRDYHHSIRSHHERTDRHPLCR